MTEARNDSLRSPAALAAGTQFDADIVTTFVKLLEREDRTGESLTARVSRVLR